MTFLPGPQTLGRRALVVVRVVVVLALIALIAVGSFTLFNEGDLGRLFTGLDDSERVQLSPCRLCRSIESKRISNSHQQSE